MPHTSAMMHSETCSSLRRFLDKPSPVYVPLSVENGLCVGESSWLSSALPAISCMPCCSMTSCVRTHPTCLHVIPVCLRNDSGVCFLSGEQRRDGWRCLDFLLSHC